MRIIAIALAGWMLPAAAQDRYMTRTGTIDFFSSTPMEDIHARNAKALSVWDAGTGAIEASALIKAFTFPRALMQEHFNESYMESSKFPKALFKGTLKGVGAEQLAKPGSYPFTVEGTVTIHGVERPLRAEGTMAVDAKGAVRAESRFDVRPADHGIRIPASSRDNIAERIEVTVRMDYTRMR